MTLDERLRRWRFFFSTWTASSPTGKSSIDDRGVETKTFDVTDGHGLKMLQRAGVAVGIVTGRTGEVVKHRARELGVEEVHQGAKDKAAVVRDILRRRRDCGPRPSATWATTSWTCPFSFRWDSR